MATFCQSNQNAMNYISAQSGDSTDLTDLINNIKAGNNIVSTGTKAYLTLYNNLVIILDRIYNYGSKGTRNPTNIPSSLTTASTFVYTQYNNLINCLGTGSTNVAAGNYITAAQMNAIGAKIKSYQFNSNRCNSCNTSQYSQYSRWQDSCYSWGGG